MLGAIEEGITDPEKLDWIVTAVLAEGDPDASSSLVPLFPLADLPASSRRLRALDLSLPL